MGRVLLICALAAALLGFDIAAAEETAPVRLPISLEKPALQYQASVIVQPGDHLWKIAEENIADQAETVGQYWLSVIEINTPSLRSGDPDLIYPGEIIELP